MEKASSLISYRVFAKYLLGISLTITLLVFTNACEYNTLEPSVDCTIPPIVTIVSTSNANCGLANGSVELAATGIAPPFIFSLAGTSQTSGNFSGLTAGNYTFSVKDATGCSTDIAVAISSADGVSITAVNTTGAGCSSNAGEIVVTATNGTLPYSYSIDGTNFQASNTFSNLSKGTRTVTVKDANDCQFTQQVTIETGVTFSSTIAPIIQNNCAISGCHKNSQSPILNTYEQIRNSAERIKFRTGNKTMPKGGSLSQTQINNIACWVEDGAPNN